jgi:hypothetical protein
MNLKFIIGAICACLAVVSFNSHAALISTLSSFDNIGSLIAGDQSNTTSRDWATASVFHVGGKNITVEGMTATFGDTNFSTAQYLEIGVYESVGRHGIGLEPGALFGTFDTSTIYSSNSRFSINLTAHSSFELQANTDYLLVWNARPGAPYLGTKRRGSPDQMINDGVAGFFTGEVLFSTSGGNSGSWYSGNQYGFDYASINGAVSVVPVPAAVWLFGSGLIGLIAVARRKA